MKRVTVIDLDSIVYIVAYRNKDMLLTSIVKEDTEKFIDEIIAKTQAEGYVGFYQVEGHKNYRNIIYPGYKSKRPKTPDYIKQWRPVIHETFKKYSGIVGLTTIESDDALSIVNQKFKDKYYLTFARIDKDLKCIPGKHYNYKSKTFEVITKEEAIHFAECQLLAGDSGDTIPSIPGIGAKKAKVYVDKCGTVFKAYKQAAKDKKVDSWIRLFNQTYCSINLLKSLDELKKYTDKQEVELFKIDFMEYENAAKEDWS